ncbi:3-hydroxybutyryl-CoA dehydrogenase [Synergistales bacterium]|nr:3-hydroxybutyryl-CoA dehydrogenase [Synergistales bacterium]
MDIKKIYVIGVGQMGSGIAQVAAQSGFDVTMYDQTEAIVKKAHDRIAANFEKLVAKGKLEKELADEAAKRIKTSVTLSDARDADLVIEAIYENPAAKKAIYAELIKVIKPETILASNTSSISITELAASTDRPDRFIGMHFFNPVPVMKLLEIITGYLTSDATLAVAMAVGEKMGKVGVAALDKPGFIVNRILIPMLNEAILLLEEGVASAEDIDKATVNGCGHPMGPLHLTDLVGLDVTLAIMEVLHREFGDSKYRPAPLLKKMVAAGKLGCKTKEGFFKY